MTLNLNFQGQIWNLPYLSQKWSNCHETKSKHIDRTLGLQCDHWVWLWSWPWLWIFKVKYGNCYISAKNGPIATKRKANISTELRNSLVDRCPRPAKTASVQQKSCLCWSERPTTSSGFFFKFTLPKYCSKHISKFKTVKWFKLSWFSSVVFNTNCYFCCISCSITLWNNDYILFWLLHISSAHQNSCRTTKGIEVSSLVDRMSTNVLSAISKTAGRTLKVTMGFDLGHDLDLEFSRLNMEFAISLSKSDPMVRCKDLQDSDRGDFWCRRAVDSSIYPSLNPEAGLSKEAPERKTNFKYRNL